MGYVALYRKFRPPVFEDVKGQDHIVTTLKNQIKSDRVGHAYLFCGTRGTGKTSVAKILARAVNCENPVDGSPCGQCEMCREIAAGNSMNVIEIDAASNNGVDNVREIIDEVSYSPTKGKKKVYIIDEVHMLSTGAFNALLKTLEEPPSYVMFILATTEVQKLPITILSRCQRYDFHRITIDTIEARLREVVDAEGIKVEDRALRYVAKTADGSMRDSLSLLDQCIAFNYGEELTYDKVLNVLGAVDTEVFSRLFSALYTQDINGALTLLADIVIQGRELSQFVNDFVWYLRNLMLVQASDQMEDVIDISSDNLVALKEQASTADIDTILRYIRVFSELSSQIRYASQKRILIEITLIKLCKPQMEDSEGAFEDRIRILEQHDEENGRLLKGIQSGQVAVSVAGGAAAAQQLGTPREKKVLDRAVPEDIQKVVSNWPGLLMRMDNPMKIYLQKARLSLGNDDTLQIVLENRQIADKYSKGESKEELQDFLDNATGKHVEFETRYLEPTQVFEENYVNLQAINFDIVTEDDIETE
ncbi:DNA polymerase III gamma and tau subunits DnaX1 [Butyrivibrio proteoclasticus B316]|uniref:DNA-directed DNA polymerase n=1 Tax=Butyrivibrio proteoclasticus (strain ATCC 51982 / DSM 14932 / B316) TaxID=515622 RepID=E0RXD6_BUTPB|nr:DNA polymerase III subunit gamma/tau [Butyrivibrio proteoclasticus]ADL32974.1 DNA polymerase III gamma and tau subunits DnaX1 [Butyrivibrio proteoclasticus B316]